ncbi:MAG: chemotaxis-specific protein-glutamate methyltransferase CheB [Lachnospiraceae bacterium]|nr:chemotaxis-specific protein-glutamate methyltransferase CheB [Lachnospiraceae bacterium]
MKKNILIVDDSALMRRVISDIINSDNRFTVKDIATNGLEALDLIVKNRLQYDCVMLDINMPKLNGLELLEQLQKNKINIKVIMVSTLTKEGAKETIIALERGALDFVTKPENYLEAKKDSFKNRLLEVLSVATGLDASGFDAAERVTVSSNVAVKNRETREDKKGTVIQKETSNVVRRNSVMPERGTTFGPHKRFVGNKEGKTKIVALACSTGGPKSLQSVIPKLSANIDAPIVLVQHMPKGFTNSLALRLDEMSEVTVKEAANGDVLKKGCVYIAPGGLQMKVVKDGANFKIVTTDDAAVGGLKPCANIMYESLKGLPIDEVTCVVLTGMGADGTLGIGELAKTNNIYVISQDEATSVVYGMPRAVAEAKLSDEIVPLEDVASAILKNVGVLNNGR